MQNKTDVPKVVECTVDENGRTGGFTLADAGRFGNNLAVGRRVELLGDLYGTDGVIARIYDVIQTGHPGSGRANYVAVDVVVLR